MTFHKCGKSNHFGNVCLSTNRSQNNNRNSINQIMPTITETTTRTITEIMVIEIIVIKETGGIRITI